MVAKKANSFSACGKGQIVSDAELGLTLASRGTHESELKIEQVMTSNLVTK